MSTGPDPARLAEEYDAISRGAALAGGFRGLAPRGAAGSGGGLTWWVARGQREHERTEAREARRQARYEQTYVDVLEHTFLIEDFINRTDPIITFSGDPDPPSFPDEKVMRRLNARTAVFGSPAVRDKLKALTQAAGEFQVASWKLHAETDRPSPSGADAWREVEERRQAVRTVHAELIELANAELDARPLG